MRSALLIAALALGCSRASAPAPTRIHSTAAVEPPGIESSAPADPPVALDDEALSTARTIVKAGFDPRDQIVRDLLEALEHPPPQAAAEKLVDELLDEQRRAEARWPTVTDNDRVDRAFAELDASGVVARQNFADCQTCGNAEIHDELQSARAAGRNVRGYVYYHQQDTDRAVDGGGLVLAYGAADGAHALEIAREVVRVLERHGLRTEWNGKVERRIGVTIDWKRRRFTRRPE
jgi:hypothetical protein